MVKMSTEIIEFLNAKFGYCLEIVLVNVDAYFYFHFQENNRKTTHIVKQQHKRTRKLRSSIYHYSFRLAVEVKIKTRTISQCPFLPPAFSIFLKVCLSWGDRNNTGQVPKHDTLFLNACYSIIPYIFEQNAEDDQKIENNKVMRLFQPIC